MYSLEILEVLSFVWICYFPRYLNICEGEAFQGEEIKGEKQLCVRKKDKTPIVLKFIQSHFYEFKSTWYTCIFLCACTRGCTHAHI